MPFSAKLVKNLFKLSALFKDEFVKIHVNSKNKWQHLEIFSRTTSISENALS